MEWSDLLALAGAVAVFLFGMELLCTGLGALSRDRLRRCLMQAAPSVWRATALGAAVTALVQSSSAVTVVLVGLAASGALMPEQAAGLIAGANIGTCTTAFFIHIGLHAGWMGVFHSSWPLLLLAVLLPALLRRRCHPALFIGAGLTALMSGMAHMQDALAPLSGSPLFARLLAQCVSPLSGLLAGTIVTAVLQSSSACIALLQAVSASGMLSLGSVVPIILGQNIGTCVTALLASLRAGRAARQTAFLHLLFNVIGAAVVFPVLLLIRQFCPAWLTVPADSAAIAWVHLACNLAAAGVFLPLRRVILARMTQNSPPQTREAAV